jgi:hypothetical protein
LYALERVKRRRVVDDGYVQSQLARVQNRQADLGHDMLGCNEVDVVNPAHVLQLQEPLGELLRCEIEAVALVSYIMVLDTTLTPLLRRNEKQPT